MDACFGSQSSLGVGPTWPYRSLVRSPPPSRGLFPSAPVRQRGAGEVTASISGRAENPAGGGSYVPDEQGGRRIDIFWAEISFADAPVATSAPVQFRRTRKRTGRPSDARRGCARFGVRANCLSNATLHLCDWRLHRFAAQWSDSFPCPERGHLLRVCRLFAPGFTHGRCLPARLCAAVLP